MLDRFQKEASRTKDGAYLILAGPGSGKTTMLLHRVLFLLNECRIPPEKVLLITFTKDAAGEMVLRFRGQVEGQHIPVTFSTFHAFFFRILKSVYPLTKEKILQGEAHEKLKQEILASFDPSLGIDETKEEFRRAFAAARRQRGVIDFDDMQTLCYTLLSKNEAVRRRWQEAFHYYMIDEAQDMSRLQYEIIRLLTATHPNVFAVGDDDQSIYAFRGAAPGVLQRFTEEYEGCRTLYLKMNYRSDTAIVTAASNLISHNQARFFKEFIPHSSASGEISYRCFRNRREELFDVLHRIRKGEETAVLYRTNEQGILLRRLLMEAGLREVSLHTFHGAKGLEFDTVFLIDVNERITPSKDAKTKAEEEEERRMFYVAMTRARHRLYLYCVQRREREVLYPSRFLGELFIQR